MNSPPHITSSDIKSHLDLPSLIEELARAFSNPDQFEIPDRHHHSFSAPENSKATMLLMPAWQKNRYGVLKMATVFPSNRDRDLPAVSSLCILQSAKTGQILATIDGAELTRIRTAAASALAARYLAPVNARTHLIIGAGALAEPLIRAHRTVRPISRTLIWNRTPERADALVDRLKDISCRRINDLSAAVGKADIITAATMSREPLVCDSDVPDGSHIDLVGAYTADMRESDSALISKASVFVDTRPGTLSEAGDLLIPIKERVFNPDDIQADLFELASRRHIGRSGRDEITVFKSVGYALEDLIAATLVFETINA